MNAGDAIAQLMELSTEIAEATLSSADGTIEAHAGCSPDRADELARAGVELIAAASRDAPAARVQVERDRGSVVVVSDGDRLAVATTTPEAVTGLVTHDLRTALRRSGAGREAS
ncbi:MAG: hypothetical protein U0R50_08465 [Gaiellales bacterium]